MSKKQSETILKQDFNCKMPNFSFNSRVSMIVNSGSWSVHLLDRIIQRTGSYESFVSEKNYNKEGETNKGFQLSVPF